MEKSYYSEYYKLERGHWWFLARNQMLVELITNLTQTQAKPLRILNVGVATGNTSERLAALGEVKSVEYDQDCYEFVKEKLNIDIIQGSILDLPFADNSYDVVCAFDVIEHVEDDLLAVREMKRVCKPNGLVCVSVPAFMWLWSEHDVINHHYRRYTLPQLESLFEKDANGSILKKTYFNFFLFFPIAAFRLFSKILPNIRSKKAAGSDFGTFNNGIVNKLMYRIFYSEKSVVTQTKRSFPVGVSALLAWQKK